MKQIRILLVEDNPEDQVILQRFLNRVDEYEYQITVVDTGEKTLALFGREQFDCLLLDYNLPDFDGLELLIQMRTTKNPRYSIPVILLTGSGSEMIAVRAIKNGAQDYLTKSELSTEKLHVAISNAIETVRLQTALKEQEDRYHALIDSIAHVVWRTNDIGHAFSVTPAWQRLTGQTDEDMQGWGWANAIHPEDKEATTQAWARALHTKTTFSNEFRVRVSDGSYRDFESRGTPVFKEDGSVLEWVGINLDITSRKEAERALQLANQRFALAAEALQAVIFDWDCTNDTIFRSIGIERLLGYKIDEVEPNRQWSLDRIHPDDLAGVTAAIDAVLHSSKNNYSIEYRMLHKNGSVVFLSEHGIIVRDEMGVATRVIGNRLDVTPLKQAQQQMAEQQEFIAHIADGVAAIIYVFDIRENRNLYVNDQIFTLSGYTPEEVQAMGSNWLTTFIHPDDHPIVLKALHNLLTEPPETTVQIEYRANHKDGSLRWLSASEKVFKYDEQELPLQTLGVAYDITTRKEAEEKLLRGTALLNTVMESTPDLVWAKDTEGRITLGNQALFNLLGGGDPKNVIALSAFELIPDPEHAQSVMDNDTRIMASGKAEMVEELLGLPEQTLVFQTLKAPLRASDGTSIGIVGVSRDITENRRLEEAERQAQRLANQRAERIVRLQSVTAQLSQSLTLEQVAHAVVDESREALGAAAGALNLLEGENTLIVVYSTGTKMPDKERSMWLRFPVDIHSPAGEVILRRVPLWFEKGEEQLIHYPAMSNVAKTHPGAWILLPLLIKDRILGVLSFSFRERREFDEEERSFILTLAQQCAQAVERATLYEEEALARKKAEEANALKMQFLGMISHELRTPLTSIKGFASTLLAKDVTFTPEKQHRFIEIINREADKLADLVEQLLDLSRLQAGSLRIEPIPQPFEQILETALIQLQTLTAHHQLILHIPKNLPQLVADTQRVAQVLVNLVGNAVKFSPAGSEVTLEVRQTNEYLQIDVGDQGIGIPPAERKKVFEAFQQLERKTPSQRLGAGLGLAICKGIVEAHGGSIWFQDRPVGTTISFTLPFKISQ